MEKKTDLRVIKTKRNIHNAFITLAMKKDFHKITVKDICTLAECGRSTFYMYYPYKDALYEEVVDTILQDILDGFRPLPHAVPGLWWNTSEEYLYNMVASLHRIKQLFPIIPPGSEMFSSFVLNLTERMIEYIYKTSIKLLDPCTEQEEARIYAATRIMFSGIINEAVYCFTKTNYSEELIQQLIKPFFHAYIDELEKMQTAV